MKTRLLIIFASAGLLVLLPSAFASENLFYGTSSIERIATSIIPGVLEKIEIKFQYNDGPYSLILKPIVDVSPEEAKPFVKTEFETFEVPRKSIKRIHGTITVDPNIPSEKIFLNIFYNGTSTIDPSQQFKSGWSDTVIIDIEKNLVPEPEQDRPIPENCGPETILQNGICVVDKTKVNPTDTSIRWGSLVYNYVQSPLKQIKSGVPIDEINCKLPLQLILKTRDHSTACVNPETIPKLIQRGWGEPVPIPEPDTGEFRYGEQECHYVDEKGESRSCIVSGWTKPESELDCEKICAPPGTKE